MAIEDTFTQLTDQSEASNFLLENRGNSNLFQRLEIEAFRAGITPRTKESREWFQNKASSLRRVNRTQIMRDESLQLTSRQVIGSMVMFFYDPKHKETLPYYDVFPLVIIIGQAQGGFLGLNLHYLAPALRAKFLDGLMDLTSDDRYDDRTKFRLRYEMLQRSAKLKYFKPCVKHYLVAHVRSRFARVMAPEWEIATFLPTAQFRKARTSQIYRESRRAIYDN